MSCSISYESQSTSSSNVKKKNTNHPGIISLENLRINVGYPLKTTNEPLCPSHWDDSLKRLALGSWVTVSSTKSTSGDDSVPDGSSIWRSFKDDVISLERNENEDMSSLQIPH